MRLAIPHPPRKVRLGQVPGAIRRIALAGARAIAVVLLLGVAAQAVGRWASSRRDFLARAQPVQGTLAVVRLPPREQREDGEARLDVLYEFEGRARSATGVRARALDVEGLGQGAHVELLVDPREPEHPHEARYARAAGAVDLLPWALGLGSLGALAWILRELRRVVRAELTPLRLGALVWLTPDEPLPETVKEIVFPARYFRQDVEHRVRARIRPGRAPVRNGEKVLAAVVPAEPTWARVIDEELARTLGWIA